VRCSVFLAVAAAGACAIGPALRAQQGDAVFRTGTRLVVLHATVAEKNGKLLTDLPKTAFRVYEDGVEQQLKTFRREDVPVSLGLVIDNSGSMRDKRAKVEAAALDLVRASNPQDEVFIVNFNDESYRDVDFTSDIHKLEAGIARIDSTGGTAMRDAIDASIRYLKASGKHDKKALIVVTDGNDNMSGIGLDEVVAEAQQRDILVYAIGLLSQEEPGDARKAKKALDTLVRATGGQAFYPEQVDEVHQIALEVAHEIRNQYILAYSPANEALDGGFRRITVKVKGPGSPVVRTRTGYYAK
jgi:Ca-activated chloride channel family protein